jgi:hypothetical protein
VRVTPFQAEPFLDTKAARGRVALYGVIGTGRKQMLILIPVNAEESCALLQESLLHRLSEYEPYWLLPSV